MQIFRLRGLMPLWVAGFGLMLAIGLAGCAADKPKPTPLQTFTPKIAVSQAWEARIGSIGFPLVPTVHGGVVYLASGNGDVVALQADNGASLWRASAGGAIAAAIACTYW